MSGIFFFHEQSEATTASTRRERTFEYCMKDPIDVGKKMAREHLRISAEIAAKMLCWLCASKPMK